MSAGRGRLLCIFIVSSLLSACADPPDKEMQQAEGAIAAARAAGAEEYAPEEFAASVDALKRAHDAAADRDYRLALNNALDSRERAENAAKMGSDGKAMARGKAERTLTAAIAALRSAEAQLKTLENGRTSTTALATLRMRIDDAAVTLQKARTALDVGDYKRAGAEASDAAGQLTALKPEFESAAQPNVRRRR